MLAQRLDHMMRAPHAASLGALVSALCAIAAILIARQALGRAPLPLTAPRLLFFLALALLFAGAGVATVHTWRRLWRRGRDPWEQTVYDRGVRGFGASMAILSPVIAIASTLSSSSERNATGFSGAVAVGLVLGVLFGTPVALWGGYWWGRGLASTFGLSRTVRRPNDLPPTV